MDANGLDLNPTPRERPRLRRARGPGRHERALPVAGLVPHVHRALIHHLSEVCLPRDLHPHTKPATNGATR